MLSSYVSLLIIIHDCLNEICIVKHSAKSLVHDTQVLAVAVVSFRDMAGSFSIV